MIITNAYNYFIYSNYKIHLKDTEDLKSMCYFMKFALYAHLLFQEYKTYNCCLFILHIIHVCILTAHASLVN